MPFTLPELPYAENALEPTIDAKTMNIHRTKHHQAYVDNLNKAIDGTPWAAMSIDEICRKAKDAPDAVKAAVRNNGGGHANHSLFWESLGKSKGGEPAGHLGEAVRSVFGGFDKFKEEFTKAALGRFGSGWAWLSVDPKGKLLIESTANQDSPVMHGNTPLLGLDVWEHAYYLLYQNRRVEYVNAFYNVVDWDAIGKRFAVVKK